MKLLGFRSASAQARREREAGIGVENFLKVTTMWWDHSTLALVTGANKGIGFEIARQLGELGYGVILAARDAAKGAAAAAALRKELPTGRFESVQADITDAESVARCAETVRNKFGKITILVNNAGVSSQPGSKPNPEEAARILACNLTGTRRMTEAMLPLLSSHARIINVCSRLGRLDQLKSDKLRSRFQHAATKDDVQAAANEFVESLEKGDHAARGWPDSMYSMSKLCEIAYTFVVAEELREKGIMVNAFCPGYCATDMCPGGTRSAREGADTAIWLASLPQVGKNDRQFVTGQLFAEQKAIEW